MSLPPQRVNFCNQRCQRFVLALSNYLNLRPKFWLERNAGPVTLDGDGMFLHAAILHQKPIRKTANRHDEFICLTINLKIHKEYAMAIPQKLKPHEIPPGVDRAIFDKGQGTDKEDADDHEFDEMRQDAGELDTDQSLNDGSSAMSDQPSNGPNNKFGSQFNE